MSMERRASWTSAITTSLGEGRDISLEPCLSNCCLMPYVQKLPQQRHHEQGLRKFATSIFICCGPLAYHCLHENIPEALTRKYTRSTFDQLLETNCLF